MLVVFVLNIYLYLLYDNYLSFVLYTVGPQCPSVKNDYDPRFLEASFSWYRRGTNATVRKSRGTSDLTFGFVVGKLVVGEAKPSLLEVLHPEPVSPLRSLYHESERKMGEKNITYCKTLTDELVFRRNVLNTSQ